MKNEINQVVENMNSLLRDCGMPVGMKVSENWEAVVGCMFCEYGHSFHVWLPKLATPVINKVVETFKRAGFSEVESFEDPSNDKFVQIDALV